MAVALGTSQSGSQSGGTSLVLASWTPDGPVLLVVTIHEQTIIVDSVSGNSLTWTKIDEQTDAQNISTCSIWKGIGTGTAGTTTITLSAALQAGDGFAAVAGAWTGTISDPFEANAFAEVGATDNNDPKVSVTTLTDNAIVAGCLGQRQRTYTLQSGETAVVLDVEGSSGGGSAVSSMFYTAAVSPAASKQAGGDNSLSADTEWIIFAVSIAPVSAATNITAPVGSGTFTGIAIDHMDLGVGVPEVEPIQ